MAKVLIVDDEEPVRRLIRGAVERMGHETDEASDGAEALELFEQCQYDLIITDILMPRVGGLKVLQTLARKGVGVKAIAISGGGKNGMLNFLSTAGTFEGVKTLAKPFRLHDLREAVRELLSGDG